MAAAIECCRLPPGELAQHLDRCTDLHAAAVAGRSGPKVSPETVAVDLAALVEPPAAERRPAIQPDSGRRPQVESGRVRHTTQPAAAAESSGAVERRRRHSTRRGRLSSRQGSFVAALAAAFAVAAAVVMYLGLPRHGTTVHGGQSDIVPSGSSRPGGPDDQVSRGGRRDGSCPPDVPGATEQAGRRCACVTVPVAPVFRTPGDPRRLGSKFRHDRVQLVDLPVAHTSAGDYRAVALPDDDTTGYGWMPARDLTPTPCATVS